jgi:hypothetical protein
MTSGMTGVAARQPTREIRRLLLCMQPTDLGTMPTTAEQTGG